MSKYFNFIFKKKSVVIDCFTYLPYVHDFAKINQAIKYVPDWWKETSNLAETGRPTIKSCPAFLDFYKKGIVIPSWFDLEITVDEKNSKNSYSWEASTKDFNIDSSHNSSEFEKFAGNNASNFKITSPWAFKTKENISFVWSQPTWNLREVLSNFTLLPATVNYKYQHGTNINYLVVNSEVKKTFRIPALTPLVIMHGLTDRPIEIKNHLVSETEWKRLTFGIENLILNRNPTELTEMYKKKIQLTNKIDSINGL